MPSFPYISPLQDLATAIPWLAEVTNKSQQEVVETLKQESRGLGTTVRKDLERLKLPKYQWSDELLSYYQSSQSFVFESFAWNTTRAKEVLRHSTGRFLLRHHQPQERILCYGDGLGFDSVFLSLLGFNVTYFEVGEPCIQFAQRVFDKNKVHVNICSDLTSLQPESFDAIVCLDVLEHVPNPPALVTKLAALLRPDGTFVAHAPFWYIHPDVSTHLASNARYSGCLKKIFRANGLQASDAGFLWCPLFLKKSRSQIAISPAAKLRLRLGQFLLYWSRLSTWPTVTAVRLFAKAKPRIDLQAQPNARTH